jgi:hypothetical protein
VNRSSAQQGNPNPAAQSKARAHGPTGSEGRPIKIPDRAFVERHLKAVRPECDQPESPFDDAEVRIGRGLKYPKDKGYGKFLETLGYDRNWAGMLAARIVEEGRVQAATARKSSEFAQALRRLANPRLETEAFLVNAKVALEAMDGTELTRGLFDELPRFEGLVFIRVLRFCLAGDLSDRPHVSRIAKAIWRRVAVSRGPKLTRASAAHEYFLEIRSIHEEAAFTWSPEKRRFHRSIDQGDTRRIRGSGLQPCAGAATAASQTGLRRLA